ncbi:MAG: CCA tRNA nucleotidyltransferase [Phycisphaerales bacterium]|nr:CCA tRNA nucleotidyltransferase [Phycisphaerales bacterium]
MPAPFIMAGMAVVDRLADLPPEALPALDVARTLHQAGCEALLAGGCVRDLLLGQTPADYDVATNAPPERVKSLFRKTRLVGQAFGVVLVRSHGVWVEVATFRSDGPYLDGRRPASVTFVDARTDARRRDFTINGMFIEPESRDVIDYVDGRADLDARLVRCIGVAADRFAEDHLRMLRAVRFAARMEFHLEAATAEAIVAAAESLRRVAPERVREELERMFGHPSRAAAVAEMRRLGLLPRLWASSGRDAAVLADDALDAAQLILERLPMDADFEVTLAVLLAGSPAEAIDRICRDLTCSNQQREAILWLVRWRDALLDPAGPSLAQLKTLMHHAEFPWLVAWTKARWLDRPDAEARSAALHARTDGIAPGAVRPAPLVTGEDLRARALPAGPLYKAILDALYERQLNETIRTRDEALHALDELLRSGA